MPPAPPSSELPELLPLEVVEPLLPELFAPELAEPELPELLPLEVVEPLLPEPFAPELAEPELALLAPLEVPEVDPLEPLPLEETTPPELDPAPAAGEPFVEQPLAKRLAPARIAA